MTFESSSQSGLRPETEYEIVPPTDRRVKGRDTCRVKRLTVNERRYEPVLSRPCQSDIEVEHLDCSGEAVILVGRDMYTGRCQCGCHRRSVKGRQEADARELSA